MSNRVKTDSSRFQGPLGVALSMIKNYIGLADVAGCMLWRRLGSTKRTGLLTRGGIHDH